MTDYPNYPAGYNDLDVIRQALALQQQAPPQQPMQFAQSTPAQYGSSVPPAPQQPMQFPQATPAQQYYGPAHQAISQLFQQSLMQQAQPGLLAQPTAQQMGLLSTQMTPSTAVPLPITGGGPLAENQFYRMTPDYFANMVVDPKTGVATDARDAPVVVPRIGFGPGGRNVRAAAPVAPGTSRAAAPVAPGTSRAPAPSSSRS